MKIAVCSLVFILLALFRVHGTSKNQRRVRFARAFNPAEDEDSKQQYVYMPDERGRMQLVDLFEDYSELSWRASHATINDITFFCYTVRNKRRPFIMSGMDVSKLDYSPYNKNHFNIFLVHGFKNHYKSKVNTELVQALLEVYEVNVFVVDWSKVAISYYPMAVQNVRVVGDIVADFIAGMMMTFDQEADQFALIGYSLGAHVAGCVGAQVYRLTMQKVSHIIGLDPAAPLITLSNTDDRLDTTDAEFVQVIHTSAGKLGMYSAIGHADFYPNGGVNQPGCGLDFGGMCSHARAYQYLAESFRSSEFYGWNCDNYNNFELGVCYANDRSYMGGFFVDKSADGDYYLKTSSTRPYRLGMPM